MIFTSNKISNYPNAKLEHELTGTGKTREILSSIGSLMELNSKGKPENTDELNQRIRDYFRICEERDIRPGIEGLCLALAVNRSTLWRWCRQEGCEKEFSEACKNAKQIIIAMTEQAGLRGLNVALYAFTMKNIAQYRDSIDIVQDESEDTNRKLSLSDLPKIEALKVADSENNISLDCITGKSNIRKQFESPSTPRDSNYEYL